MPVPMVKARLFEKTEGVVWTGGDGKPRCVTHPAVCLVKASAAGLTGGPDDHVCIECMRDRLG